MGGCISSQSMYLAFNMIYRCRNWWNSSRRRVCYVSPCFRYRDNVEVIKMENACSSQNCDDEKTSIGMSRENSGSEWIFTYIIE